MFYTGIDVGKSGGITVLNEKGNIELLSLIPKIGSKVDYNELWNIISNIGESITLIEDVHSIFGTSSKSNFSFGEIKGVLIGMVVAAGHSYELVPPKTWQKELWTNGDMVKKPNGRVDTKKTSLLAAKRLFPNESFIATQRSKKPHDGLYDATLIAEYGRRQRK